MAAPGTGHLPMPGCRDRGSRPGRSRLPGTLRSPAAHHDRPCRANTVHSTADNPTTRAIRARQRAGRLSSSPAARTRRDNSAYSLPRPTTADDRPGAAGLGAGAACKTAARSRLDTSRTSTTAMSVERPTGGPAAVNPRSTVHHRACHHAPRTHRLGCRRGSGATCYMLTVPVREAAVHQMWTPGEAWVRR